MGWFTISKFEYRTRMCENFDDVPATTFFDFDNLGSLVWFGKTRHTSSKLETPSPKDRSNAADPAELYLGARAVVGGKSRLSSPICAKINQFCQIHTTWQ
jgi:hypothetical protein